MTTTTTVDPAALVETAVAALAPHQGSVVLDDSTGANLRWAANSLTTNGQMHQRRMTVIAHVEVADGLAVGIASAPVVAVEDVTDLVGRAVAAGRSSGPAEDVVVLVTGEPAPGWEEGAAGGGIEVFAQLARGLGEELTRARGGGERWYGFAEHVVTTTWLGTTAGVRRRSVDRMGRIEVNAKTDAGQDGSRGASAWVGQSYQHPDEVDVHALAAELQRRIGWSARTVDLPAGRYETLLPPSAVADLLIYAYWTMSRRDAEEGRNVYAGEAGRTRIGERLSTLPLTLASDPGAPGMEGPDFAVVRSPQSGMTSAFDNGAPVGRVEWLREGVLEELVAPRASAGDEVRFPTDNLVADAGGTATLEEMIAATERGLLLTCLWYMREVDPETLLLTGLTRDGVYLVEDGEVVAQVNNFRFNESPVDLLRRATEASVSERTLCREWNDWFTRTVVPALRVPDFNMSTVSQAS
ncbi:metallopeptidase TldD-related protein [Auraticoccus monumenti]|uniref:Predicted Zn-dependent protease or its inactivated homolog n=1 Tax=Auraticoccus monumenti TaxID=675864 RepID=A0A1G7CSJ7_9ACTN|nr:metallopeptidase TldD-related protein [Auraticoccus monumenti]SDE42322.1 Predicted Zn-dependent protease or its inactivated homolog [Auraticoccus monumenti]